jgi:hypothetical protein
LFDHDAELSRYNARLRAAADVRTGDAARLLVKAGADVDALSRWVEIGRQRASAPNASA